MARAFRHESQPPTFALTEGAQLKSIELPSGDVFIVGSQNVASITVQMEAGQMGMVPWARVRLEDGRVSGVNLAHAEPVEFADRLPVMPDEEEEFPCALA